MTLKGLIGPRHADAIAVTTGTAAARDGSAIIDAGLMMTKSGVSAPVGAIDSHVHVLEPAEFPYAASRSYTPGPATVSDLVARHDRIGVSRTVLVQPSVYGTDNRCLLRGLSRLGPDVARGIAVVDILSVTDDDLHALRRAGVVGLRVNLNTKGEAQAQAVVAAVSRAVARAAPHDLAVQVYVDLALVADLADTIETAPMPIILDHFAGARAVAGPAQPGFDALRRLLADGRVWIKLSAPYRASTQAPDYADLAPIARALIETNSRHLVWGSDWPHTGGGAERRDRSPSDTEPFRQVDDAHNMALLSSWAGDPGIASAILVDNAARLFRFCGPG